MNKIYLAFSAYDLSNHLMVVDAIMWAKVAIKEISTEQNDDNDEEVIQQKIFEGIWEYFWCYNSIWPLTGNEAKTSKKYNRLF